ncbi:MAG: apolipoprotein N-acyltransferase [bacterium]|nr:apolipoprotein N-acyltransferase [bacterium]
MMKDFLKNDTAKKSMLVLLSAVLSNLSYPPVNMFWVQFFSLSPFLYVMLKERSYKRAVFYSTLFGMAFHFILLFWLRIFHLLSLPGVLLGYFVYFGVFGLALKFLLDKFPSLRILVIPSLWVCHEYIRSSGFLGFPWGLTAHSQWNFLSFIQIADTFGIWIISFLVVLANVIILEIFLNRSSQKSVKRLSQALAVILLLPVLYGMIRIRSVKNEIKNLPGLKIALVQSDVNPNLSWERIKYDAVSRLTCLSEKASLQDPDLLVWSETAILDYVKYYNDNYQRLIKYPALKERLFYNRNVLRIARDLGNYIFTGIPHYEKKIQNNKVREDEYNAAVLISPEGVIEDLYYKIHLVPFGEWFPFKVPFINRILTETSAGHWTPGRRYTVFEILKKARVFRFSGLICYEGIFGDLCRKFILQGAEFLVNVTNDTWSFTPQAEWQHVIADVFRTVETRVAYVRCGNSGVTCFINQYGRITSRLPLFQQGYLVDTIQAGPKRHFTFYTRHGDYLPRILLIFNFLLILYPLAVRYLFNKR